MLRCVARSRSAPRFHGRYGRAGGGGEDVGFDRARRAGDVEGRHFGIRQRFTSAITAYDRPRHFQDSMVRGAFHSFVHDHYFETCEDGTRMTDVLAFRSPLGVLGAIVDRLLMTKYLTRMLTKRNEVVKAVLERGQG